MTVMALSGLSEAAYVGAVLSSEGKKLDDMPAEDRTYVGFTRHFPRAYFFAKLPVAVLSVACVLAAFFFLRVLVGGLAAAVAAGLLALEPFLIAHARIACIDSTFAMLMTCALLSFVCFVKLRRRRYLIASAVLAGLTVLTRSAGVVLFPVCAVLYVIATWTDQGYSWRVWAKALPGMVREGLQYLAISAVVFVALFPAMWVAPLKTIGRIGGAVSTNITADNPKGNPEFYVAQKFYFKGETVNDPGPSYYGWVLLYRTSPLVLLLACAAAVHLLAFGRRMEPGARLVQGAMLIYGIVYIVGMSLISYKQDRWFLPALAALVIMAGVELAVLLSMPAQRLRGALRGAPALVTSAALLVTGVVTCYPLVQLQPNYLSYFNPVFYGPEKVWHDHVVGFGEGLHEAAQYLNGKPGAENLTVASSTDTAFSPFFVGRTIELEDLQQGRRADYLVLYAHYVQQQLVPTITNAYYPSRTPECTITINGIEYAWIYKIAP